MVKSSTESNSLIPILPPQFIHGYNQTNVSEQQSDVLNNTSKTTLTQIPILHIHPIHQLPHTFTHEILIVTTSRFNCVKRNVESCREQGHWNFIRIGDDGPRDESLSYRSFCLKYNCVYEWLGPDIGLSAKRNRLVQRATTDIVMILDDDIVWSESIDIHRALRILHTGVHLVTFGLRDRDAYAGSIRLKNGIMHRCQNHAKPSAVDATCVSTEIGLNILLGKTSVLRDHPWDEELKLNEHPIWFLGLHNYSIVACPRMQFGHESIRTPGYSNIRKRNYMHIWKTKYGITKYTEERNCAGYQAQEFNDMTFRNTQQKNRFRTNHIMSSFNSEVTRSHKHKFNFFMYTDLQPFVPLTCSGHNTDSPDKIFIEQLENHPQRTLDATKASLFVIPLQLLQSFECNRDKYDQWLAHSINNLQASFWFQRYNGIDHIMPAFHYKFSGFSDINQILLPPSCRSVLQNVTMTRYEAFNDDRVQFLKPSSIFETYYKLYDRKKKIIVVPYLIDAKISNIQESYTEWSKRRFAIYYHTRSSQSDHGGTKLRHRPWTGKTSSQKCMSCSINRGHTDSKKWLRGWQDSKFCLVIRGDTPTSHSFYRAVKSSCIPVLISTGFEAVGFPFSSFVDLSSFVVEISEEEWLENGITGLEQSLNSIATNSSLIQSKLTALHRVQPILVWNHPDSITTTSVLWVFYEMVYFMPHLAISHLMSFYNQTF